MAALRLFGATFEVFNMTFIKSPYALIIPSYILGTTLAVATYHLLPMNSGHSVSAGLVLILLTFTSYWHSKIEKSWLAHIYLWGVCGMISIAFVKNGLADIPGLDIGINELWNWWQVGFLAVQQACYFGLHAFRN
jgi:hypothetical protein